MAGDLFDDEDEAPERGALPVPAPDAPLADRMRPRDLPEVVGPPELVGPESFLAKAIAEDRVPSLVFWGPPGSGKTTLARIIAARTKARFLAFSAVVSGIKEIRTVMEEAGRVRRAGRRTLLFVDEIHRFNRAQQDAFLPFVESGGIVLVGATTENPSFELNGALLSRLRVIVLPPLKEADLIVLLKRALADPARGLAARVTVGRGCLRMDRTLCRRRRPAGADGSRGGGVPYALRGESRFGLGCRSSRISSSERSSSTTSRARSTSTSSRRSTSRSATPTSTPRSTGWPGCSRRARTRSTSPAAWSASRPRTSASPTRARSASRSTARDAVDFIGMPEGALALAQVVVYLALAPKSNALYTAYGEAVADVHERPNEPPPLAIRNAPTKLMKETGYGKGYVYAHDSAERTAGPRLPARLPPRAELLPPGGRGEGSGVQGARRGGPEAAGGAQEKEALSSRHARPRPLRPPPSSVAAAQEAPVGLWHARLVAVESHPVSFDVRIGNEGGWPRRHPDQRRRPRSRSAAAAWDGETLMLYLAHYDARIAAKRKGDSLAGTYTRVGAAGIIEVPFDASRTAPPAPKVKKAGASVGRDLGGRDRASRTAS